MRRRRVVTMVVCAGVFLSSLDLFIVNLALPSIGKDLGTISTATLSWIVSAYAIVFAAALVPAGRWADAYGRKRVFVLGLATFVVASAGCAVTQTVPQLVAARVVQGVGGAMMVPASLSLMLHEFTDEQRPAAIGVWAAAGAVAAAAGPPLGGLLVEADWRLVFLLNVPVGLVALLGARELYESRELGVPRPDVLGALAFAAAIGAPVAAIVNAGHWGWGSPQVVALLAVPAVVLPLLWRRSREHPGQLLERSILIERGFALPAIASVVFFLGFGTILLAGVLFLTSVWHESVLDAGLMLAPGPVTAAFVSVSSGAITDRVGYRGPGAAGGLLLAAASGWWIAMVGTAPAYASQFLPGMLLAGAAVGLLVPTVFASGTTTLPAERFATGTAVLTMARAIGIALGVAVVAACVSEPGAAISSFRAAWYASAIGGVAAAAFMLSLRSRRDARPTTAPPPLAQAPIADD